MTKPNSQSAVQDADQFAHGGQAVYTPLTLKVYDLLVVRFSCSYLWKCPASRLLAHYQQHLTGHHLEVGVGTGYFPDHSQFPMATPRLTLLDMNPNTLRVGAQKLARYSPRLVEANILKPIAITELHSSAALNFVLHCLPGDIDYKAVALENVKACVADDGVVYGSTILSQGVSYGPAAKALMNVYNKRQIFSNSGDSLEGLRNVLAKTFKRHRLEVEGCVALFAGWK